jgi:P-type Cu2+ transporter
MSGTLRVKASAASEATLLAEITRLLDSALQARSRYMRLADRASRLYSMHQSCTRRRFSP